MAAKDKLEAQQAVEDGIPPFTGAPCGHPLCAGHMLANCGYCILADRQEQLHECEQYRALLPKADRSDAALPFMRRLRESCESIASAITSPELSSADEVCGASPVERHLWRMLLPHRPLMIPRPRASPVLRRAGACAALHGLALLEHDLDTPNLV
jgi:hypothetical protein